jgi:hypothetical protein
MQGFWRQLYYPDLEEKIQSMNSKIQNLNDTIQSLEIIANEL